VTSRGLRWTAAALIVLGVTSIARAALDVRPTKLEWDKDKNDVLRGVLPIQDAIDNKAIKKKLADGLPVTVQVRGYVVLVGSENPQPIVFTAHTCRVAYDLWNEVYEISENGTKRPPVVTMKGVYRRCTNMDMNVVLRSDLPTKPPDYELHVKVDVNPVDPELQKKIQQWVTRPSGTTGAISPGDALFATFANVFMSKKIPPAELVIEFRTGSFPP
jgi:hypothetical protein